MRVLRSDRRAGASAVMRRAGFGLAALVAALFGGTCDTQDAVANGDTRTLSFFQTNTKETLTVTFRRNGQYDPRALEQLNWFMRDWRHSQEVKMDPRLFDTVWEVYRESGSSAPVYVNSAYRSPKTNAMLRRRSSVVAKHSQHMLGKAMDFYLPDVPAVRLRAIGMRLQRGGVGYYPNAYTPFVHLDVGSVRAWPRMTRDQLVRIFPDGKTVHIPADGRPLPGYELARAEILAGGGTVSGYSAFAEAGPAMPTRRKSLWATLFGGSDEDEDEEEIRTTRPGRRLFASGTPATPQDYYASDSNASVVAALEAANRPQAPAPRPAPAPAPTPVAAPQPEPAPAPMPAPSPTVVAAVAPALREEIAPPPPLPPTRIAGPPSTVATPTGPTLAWQEGPPGKVRDGEGRETPSFKEIAFAPVPPRRPEDIVATGAIAYAPIPPARPSALAASNPIPGLPELRGTTQLAMDLPADLPLPPPRPVSAPIVVASAAPVEIPMPTPAAREAIRIAKPSAPAKAPQKASHEKKHASTVRALLTAGPSLNMGFSARPLGDLATNRFTGPAVKPLPVAR